MQKIFKSILSFCLAVAVCLGTAAIFGATQYAYTVADAATADTYYSSITAQGGAQLLGQLHDLITSSRKKYSSYDDCHYKGPATDPGSGSNTVMEFYTHIDIDYSKWDEPGGWNREHVWPKSDSNGLWSKTVGGGSDLHHIRPAEKDINNSRGNKLYGEVGTGGTKEYPTGSSVLGGYSNSTTFEPMDNVKGDVARILMYVYTHYNRYTNAIFGGYAKEDGSDVSGYQSSYFGTLNFTHIIKASNEDAAKQLILKWNKLDPVDEIERYRNEAVYVEQGNRNPFIDNESYADAIWGGGTVVEPPNPGPGPQPSDTLKSISLSASTLNLNVGDTQKLTVTPNPGNASASVTWTSSNTSVATVSGGTVTAKAAGTATITATSTVNASIKATATVTVKQASSSEITTGTIIITRGESFTSSGGYATYSWSEGGIGGTAFIYATNPGAMQFNTSKTSQYIASDKPTAGAIRKVTVKCGSNSNNFSWALLTSDEPYSGITSGNPSKGNRYEANEATDGSWTVSGNDTYFALVLGGSGVSYVESITIEYDTADPSEAFHNAVEAINGDGTLNAWRTTLNAAINAYKNLTETDKTEAAADIAKLNSAIASYNEKVKAYNDADKVALKGAGVFL